MINKQNLWFTTLFSLILVLGVYYINIDDEVKTVLKTEDQNDGTVIEITESDLLVALEVENEEERQTLMEEYQNILLQVDSTLEEKNNAYESIQKLNDSSSYEEKIKTLIKDKFKLDSFVKLEDNQISIVINSKEHNEELANSIIRCVQELFDEEKYITVKFNS